MVIKVRMVSGRLEPCARWLFSQTWVTNIMDHTLDEIVAKIFNGLKYQTVCHSKILWKRVLKIEMMEAGVELSLLSTEIEPFSFDISNFQRLLIKLIVICNQFSRIYYQIRPQIILNLNTQHSPTTINFTWKWSQESCGSFEM